MNIRTSCFGVISLIIGALSFVTSAQARFLQIDPIGYGDNMNLYVYVGNDPTNLTDPTGQCSAISCERIVNFSRNSTPQEKLIAAGMGVAALAIGTAPAIIGAAIANPVTATELTVSAAELAAGDALGTGIVVAGAAKGGTEVVQRVMSRAEAAATAETGLMRGGREGTNFVTDSANSSAQRARQRLSLPDTPEIRATMEVPEGAFSSPSTVRPQNGMPGGGLERQGTGQIPAKILREEELKR